MCRPIFDGPAIPLILIIRCLMSETYIGPFVRILPLSEGQEPPLSEREPSPNMLASQAPKLPLPTRLNFGSDSRPGFTDPNRYESMATSPRAYGDGRTSSSYEKLPPVSQLLTPSSRIESSGVPYSSISGPGDASSAHRLAHSSGYSSESRLQPQTHYFQSSYQSSQAPYSSERPVSSHNGSHQYQTSFRGAQDQPSQHYGAGASPALPTPQAARMDNAGQSSWYSAHSPSYETGGASTPSADRRGLNPKVPRNPS